MTSLVHQLAQQACRKGGGGGLAHAWPDQQCSLCVEITQVLRAALWAAVIVARSQRDSSQYQADPDTYERIAAEIEALAQ